jgi:hypothetical protein
MESRAYQELTLITCYPFYFVGAAPKRFVVHALPEVTTRIALRTMSPKSRAMLIAGHSCKFECTWEKDSDESVS